MTTPGCQPGRTGQRGQRAELALGAVRARRVVTPALHDLQKVDSEPDVGRWRAAGPGDLDGLVDQVLSLADSHFQVREVALTRYRDRRVRCRWIRDGGGGRRGAEQAARTAASIITSSAATMRWLLIAAITRPSHSGVSRARRLRTRGFIGRRPSHNRREIRQHDEDGDGHGLLRKHGCGDVTLRPEGERQTSPSRAGDYHVTHKRWLHIETYLVRHHLFGEDLTLVKGNDR